MNFIKKHYKWFVIFIGLVAAIVIWSKRSKLKLNPYDSEQIKSLRQEVVRTCEQAKTAQNSFQKKFPESNNEAMQSEEWKTTMGWSQACDTANADLENAINPQRSTSH